MPQSVKDFVDVLFKLAIVAGIAVFLSIYATNRAVGRYLYIANGELEYVMDTTTGIIYQGGSSMNHITGQETLGGKAAKKALP
jgi:hypothetical protein